MVLDRSRESRSYGDVFVKETLLACPNCNCHVRLAEGACPHCGEPFRKGEGATQRTAGALLLGLVVATTGAAVNCSSSRPDATASNAAADDVTVSSTADPTASNQQVNADNNIAAT